MNIKDYQFKTNGQNFYLIQIKEDEICFSESTNSKY